MENLIITFSISRVSSGLSFDEDTVKAKIYLELDAEHVGLGCPFDCEFAEHIADYNVL